MALAELDRLREEDPHTGRWAEIADTRIIGQRSRFEVDLNRPREKAVYQKPEDAWGLNVWKSPPTDNVVAASLAAYDQVYADVHQLLSTLLQKNKMLVIYDLHTYNHRRNGPDGAPADPAANPEVNIGTGTLDRTLWGGVLDRFMSDLGGFDYFGRHLDVRENIKFRGGNFSAWVHQEFPRTVCSIAIEFKKFFMDEWSGKPDHKQIEKLFDALVSTRSGVIEELQKRHA